MFSHQHMMIRLNRNLRQQLITEILILLSNLIVHQSVLILLARDLSPHPLHSITVNNSQYLPENSIISVLLLGVLCGLGRRDGIS